MSASVLDSDLGRLASEIRRAERAGADRIHLDVMDGHFVPNITFGARTIKALRRVTKLPFDAHLMIEEPGRFMAEFLDAGCDSVSFHAEVAEPLEPVIDTIHRAGRAAGLAIKPETPVSLLEPYRRKLDIVLVMCVEPGFGGQTLMRDVARKGIEARRLFSDRAWGGEVHADGGVNRDTAEFVGACDFDILIAGSALYRKGRDMAREVRLIRALADEGYQYQLNAGVPPIPRDGWVTFSRLPRGLGRTLARELEREGVPVIQLRSDRPDEAPGRHDDELLIPASAERAAVERLGSARTEAERRARAGDGGQPGGADGRASPAANEPLGDGRTRGAARTIA